MPPYYSIYKSFLNWLSNSKSPFDLKLQGDNSFTVTVVKHQNQITGVSVSNLGNQPFLPIELFRLIIEFLSTCPNNKAPKGNAITAQVGHPGMETNTVEGLVAHFYYNVPVGIYAFSRITPLANVLGNALDETKT